MWKKLSRKQYILRFAIYVATALAVMLILEYMGIKLSFWQQFLFVALPILLILDFIFARIAKKTPKKNSSKKRSPK